MKISMSEQNYLKYGLGYVPCKVSGRFLNIKEKQGDNLFIDVMSTNGNKPRKICELIVDLYDLEKALYYIKSNKN